MGNTVPYSLTVLCLKERWTSRFYFRMVFSQGTPLHQIYAAEKGVISRGREDEVVRRGFTEEVRVTDGRRWVKYIQNELNCV